MSIPDATIRSQVGSEREPVRYDPPSDPFDETPAVLRVVGRFIGGVLVMILTLTLLGVAVTSSAVLRPARDWDAAISVDVAGARTDRAVNVARLATRTGDTLQIIALIAIVTAVLLVARKWRAVAFLPMAMLAEFATFLAVNFLVGRERPAVEKIGPLPGTYSFPSGHIAATFVCWAGISVLLACYGLRKLAAIMGVVAIVLTLAMGWARVYLGMHYTIDVIVGFVMGVAAVAVAAWALNVDVARCFDSVRDPGRFLPPEPRSSITLTRTELTDRPS